MKNAAPPTAATARMPTMITEAITIDTQVGSLFALIPTIYEFLAQRVHQPARLVCHAAVIIAVAERGRRLEFFAGRRRLTGLHRELPELEMRPAVDPFSTLGLQRLPQIGVRVGGPAERDTSRAALEVPERVFAKHPLPRIACEARKPFVERALGVCGAPRAEQRRTGLQPHEPIPRIALSQRGKRLQRIVVPLLPVVDKDECETRVVLVFGAERGRLLDHPHPFLLPAAEADDVRHPAKRE